MLMNTVFNLIISVTYNRSNYNQLITEQEKYYRNIALKNTPQLEGSPLLEKDNSPLEACLELNQAQRKKIGIHGNENHTYYLVKEKIGFQIGKIKLWLFKNGIGFITIGISADEKTENSMLDLVSSLCTIYIKSKITYEQAIGKGISETRTITIKSLIENILALSDNQFIYPYEKDTFNRARCIFYGYGDSENEEFIAYLLEMLRGEIKSSRSVAHGIEDKNAYKPYKYITWAVSENVLAAFGDTKLCGMENNFFLTDNGGLRQSVFANYLPVYLNCLSVHLKLELICKQNNIYNAVAIRSATKEIVNELHDLLNTPLYDITQENHINELFREYVCQNALNLPKRLEMFETGEIREYIEETYKRVISIDETTQRIENQLQTVVQFVETDMKDWLFAKKNQLQHVTDTDEEERIIATFMATAMEYINRKIGVEKDLIDKKENELQEIFGGVWNKLLPTSKTSLISAGVLWESCARITQTDFDFSGVCISATSALEAELKKIFFVDFKNYISHVYGTPDKKAWKKTFDEWPEILLSCKKKFYESKVNKNVYPKIKCNEVFTMGMMPFLFGRNDKNSTEEQNELLRSRMEEYLKTILLDDYVQDPLGILYKPGDRLCFVENCEKVRSNFRNPAAHTNVLTRENAEMCYQTIVGKQNAQDYTASITGLILTLYGYLK